MPRQADWYFDYVSPYAYLQLMGLGRLPADLEVRPVPVLFAGLLGHWGMLGPAEIPAKRRQTYRYCHWLAARRGIPFRTPPRHPFNPLAILRLTVALGTGLDVVRAIFHHVWGAGRDGQDPDAVRALAGSLGVDDIEARIGDPAIKERLRANTEAAARRGAFGVPTFAIDGQIFWGEDVTGMLLDYLADPDAFTRGEMARLGDLPAAAERRQSRLGQG